MGSFSRCSRKGRVCHAEIENFVREMRGFGSVLNLKVLRENLSRFWLVFPEQNSSADEPYRLAERYHAKPMHVEAEMAREYNKDRDWPDEAAINPQRP